MKQENILRVVTMISLSGTHVYILSEYDTARTYLSLRVDQIE